MSLKQVHNVLSRQIQQKLTSLELTSAQYLMLRHLSTDGPQTITTLAAKLGVTLSNLTGVVDRLESAGWLERQRGDDRRNVNLSLTTTGQQHIEGAMTEVRAYVRTLFTPLSATELQALQSGLHKLLNGLEIEVAA